MNLTAIKMLVGMFLVLLILAIFGGSGGLQFFAWSIICTVGISLILWVPAFFVVGSIFVWIISAVTRGKVFGEGSPVSNDKHTNKRSLTNKQQALADYIWKAKAQTLNDNQILAILMKQGWSEQEVKEAFAIVAHTQT